MSFQAEGKLYKVYPTEQKSETFQTREFAIEMMNGNYPQYIKFQLLKDKCSLIDQYREGDFVKVSFDLSGRIWNEKVLTNLNAWRIEKSASGNDNSGNSMNSTPSTYGDDAFAGLDTAPIMPIEDDLPF